MCLIHAISRNTGLSIPTLIALLFVVITTTWLTYRGFEPYINPVVTDFSINHIEHFSDYTLIAGTFHKRRDCEFKNVVAYDGQQFLAIDFMIEKRIVSRLPKLQSFGTWKLSPKANHLEIYTRHECTTGTVVSLQYKGVIK